MKYTPVNHPDRINIENALEKAEELCLQVRLPCARNTDQPAGKPVARTSSSCSTDHQKWITE